MLASRLGSYDDRYEHKTLSRADVEYLATEVYDWRRRSDDLNSYWVGRHQAAELLCVSSAA